MSHILIHSIWWLWYVICTESFPWIALVHLVLNTFITVISFDIEMLDIWHDLFWHDMVDISFLYNFSYSFFRLYLYFIPIYSNLFGFYLVYVLWKVFVAMYLFLLHWKCWYNWIEIIAKCHTQKWKAKQKKFKLLKHDETKILCI